MSGLVALFRGDGAPVHPAPASAMMRALAHRARDGQKLVARPGAALGHLHFWTTPEEVGEEQPRSDAEARLDVAFDGRVDNRDALLRDLELAPATSDAGLVLAGWCRWGESLLPRLLGPFALVVLDGKTRSLVAARDGMGSRPLYYRARGGLVLVASEESAILAHPEVSAALDDRYLAQFFVADAPWDGATAFEEVRELLPGHSLVASSAGVSIRRFWAPDVSRRLRYREDAEYAEHYRELLGRSVSCRLRAVGPASVMLSGGMDSTAVAALASRQLALRGRAPLRSFSWVFDELAGCERRWIATMVDAFRLDATYLRGDDAWPLREPDAGVTPNLPWVNTFAHLKDDVYRAAAERGCRTMLVGCGSDVFYSGSEDRLLDALREGRVSAFGGEARAVLASGPRALLEDRGVRRVLRFALKGGRPAFERDVDAFPWLTSYARSLVAASPASDDLAATARRPEQYESIFGPLARLGASEIALQSARGLELRDPYRDRRLCEFMLAVPADQLFRTPHSKAVHRAALRDVLPPPVLAKTERTDLEALFNRGLLEREVGAARAFLDAPDALWRRFVRSEWMHEFFPGGLTRPPVGRECLVPWQCLSSQLWTRRLRRSGEESERTIKSNDELRLAPIAV